MTARLTLILALGLAATCVHATTYSPNPVDCPLSGKTFVATSLASYNTAHSPADLSGSPDSELLQPRVSPYTLMAWFPAEAQSPKLDAEELRTLRAFAQNPIIHLSDEEMKWHQIDPKADPLRNTLHKLWLTRECYRLRKPNALSETYVNRALFYATKTRRTTKLNATYRLDTIRSLKKFIAKEKAARRPREERLLSEYLLGELLRQERKFEEASALFKSAKAAAEKADYQGLLEFINKQDAKCTGLYALPLAKVLDGLRAAYEKLPPPRRGNDSGEAIYEILKSDQHSEPEKFDEVKRILLADDSSFRMSGLNSLAWDNPLGNLKQWWLARLEEWHWELWNSRHETFSAKPEEPPSMNATQWLDGLDLESGVTTFVSFPFETTVIEIGWSLPISQDRLLELNPKLNADSKLAKNTALRIPRLPFEPEEPPDPTQNSDDPFADLGGHQSDVARSEPTSPERRSLGFGGTERGVVSQISELALTGNKKAQAYLLLWFDTVSEAATSSSYYGPYTSWLLKPIEFLSVENPHRPKDQPWNATQQLLLDCAKYFGGDDPTRTRLIEQSMTSPKNFRVIFTVFHAKSDRALESRLFEKFAADDCPPEWLEVTSGLFGPLSRIEYTTDRISELEAITAKLHKRRKVEEDGEDWDPFIVAARDLEQLILGTKLHSHLKFTTNL